MRVLVLGANGFIGAAIVSALVRAGITVRAAVRDPDRLARRFPQVEAIRVDLREPAARDPSCWHRALDRTDAVVNAAGVLQPRRERDAWAVHCHALAALYAACEWSGVRRVIHVSAIGVVEAETAYARSKRAGEEALMARDLDWTILRPTIVFGDTSHGGTSLLRALAAFPGFTPLIDGGATPLDFIHTDDLAAGIVQLLRTRGASHAVLSPAGAERTTLREAVQAYRRWLGLPARPVIKVPLPIVKMLARVGDVAKLDPITTTAVVQFQARLTGDAEGFEAATGVRARGLGAALAQTPSGSQDLWHARLYLLRPLVRLALAVLWLVSGWLGIFADPAPYAGLVEPVTSDARIARALATAMGLVDLAIAGALVLGWRLKEIAAVQLVVVLGYTTAFSVLAPSLWGDLLGGLLKNIPILALIGVHRVLEEER